MLYAKPGAGRGVAPKPLRPAAGEWRLSPCAQRPERPSRPVPSGGILDTTTYMLMILTRGSGL